MTHIQSVQKATAKVEENDNNYKLVIYREDKSEEPAEKILLIIMT